jgi:hypothetical protein
VAGTTAKRQARLLAQDGVRVRGGKVATFDMLRFLFPE